MKILILFLVLAAILIIYGITASAKEVDHLEHQYGYSDIAELATLIDNQSDIMEAALLLEEAGKKLKYEEGHIVFQIAKAEWELAAEIRNICLPIYSELLDHWRTKEKEYPEACYVWSYLKDNTELNDYACAGIMGNLMAETGGQTLNLNPQLYTSGYYGICQWGSHYPEIHGKTLEEQCKFLIETIEKEFRAYGSLYKKDFEYTDFCNMTDAEEAAIAFAKCYERCDMTTYSIRQKNAYRAYGYFVEDWPKEQ